MAQYRNKMEDNKQASEANEAQGQQPTAAESSKFLQAIEKASAELTELVEQDEESKANLAFILVGVDANTCFANGAVIGSANLCSVALKSAINKHPNLLIAAITR